MFGVGIFVQLTY